MTNVDHAQMQTHHVLDIQIMGYSYSMRDQCFSSHIARSVFTHSVDFPCLFVCAWCGVVGFVFSSNPAELSIPAALLPKDTFVTLSFVILESPRLAGFCVCVCVCVCVCMCVCVSLSLCVCLCVFCWTQHSCSPHSGLITSHFTPLLSSQLHIIVVSPASPLHSSLSLQAAVLFSIYSFFPL